MQKRIYIILALLLIISPALAQTPSLPNADAGRFLAGEHYPLIYSGSGQINGSADPCTTAWYQVGYSPNATAVDNRNIGIFNPEVFSVGLKLATWGAGDSAQVYSGRFESAYDSTGAVFWNADSSNYFIEDGIYGHKNYGSWRFESLSDTSRQSLYRVRALTGGYIRLIFASNLADTCQVNWSLICEH